VKLLWIIVFVFAMVLIVVGIWAAQPALWALIALSIICNVVMAIVASKARF
jgi:hypothetical protein